MLILKYYVYYYIFIYSATLYTTLCRYMCMCMHVCICMYVCMWCVCVCIYIYVYFLDYIDIWYKLQQCHLCLILVSLVVLYNTDEQTYSYVLLVLLFYLCQGWTRSAGSSFPNCLFTHDKTRPCNNNTGVTTYINIYSYTIQHRDTFTLNQSKHL